jgi:outer membrane protein assembly factor BamB
MFSRVALAAIGLAATVLLPARGAEAQCNPNPWLSTIGLGGFPVTPSRTVNDTTYNPFNQSLAFVARDKEIIAIDLRLNRVHWRTTPHSSTIQWTPTPVPIEAMPRRESVFVASGDGGLVWRFDETGMPQMAAMGPADTTSLRRGACAADRVDAQPAVQLRQYADATFKAAFPNDDLVIVVTHHMCGDSTGNKIYGLRGSNLNSRAWVFNDFLTHDVGYGSDGCAIDYASNTAFCGTDLPAGRWQNTLWALDTTNGNLKWSVNAGSIHIRPHFVPPDKLYVGTEAGSVALYNAKTGVLVWQQAVTAAPIVDNVWPESRPGGFAGSVWLTDGFGDLHYLFEVGNVAFPVWTTSIGGGKTLSGMVFDNTHHQLYASGSDGRVYQIDPGSGGLNEYVTPGNLASAPTLGVSTPGVTPLVIDKLTVVSGTELRHYCVPWDPGTTVAMAAGPGFDDDPRPAEPRTMACTRDNDCPAAMFGVPPCIVPKCFNGHCQQGPAPANTPCSAAQMGCRPATVLTTCKGMTCPYPNPQDCSCSAIGDRACPAGRTCCGRDGCVDILTDERHCGGCTDPSDPKLNHACPAGTECVAGVCERADECRNKEPKDPQQLLRKGATSVAFGDKCMAWEGISFPDGTRGMSPLGGNGLYSFASDILFTNGPDQAAPTYAQFSDIAITPDFRTVQSFTAGPPWSGRAPQLHATDGMRSGLQQGTILNQSTGGTAPWTTPRYLNDGPTFGSTVNDKYVAQNPGRSYVFVGNHPDNGWIASYEGQVGTTWKHEPSQNYRTGGTRVHALAHATCDAHLGGTGRGLVYAGYALGDEAFVEIICTNQSNQGPCAAPPVGGQWPHVLKLGEHDPRVRPLPLYRVQRILNIATDRRPYGDVYVEAYGEDYDAKLNRVGESGRILRINCRDFSVRDILDLQLDNHRRPGELIVNIPPAGNPMGSIYPFDFRNEARLGIAPAHFGGARLAPGGDLGSDPIQARYFYLGK